MGSMEFPQFFSGLCVRVIVNREREYSRMKDHQGEFLLNVKRTSSGKRDGKPSKSLSGPSGVAVARAAEFIGGGNQCRMAR